MLKKNKVVGLLKTNQKQIKNFLIYASTDGLSRALPFIVLPFIAETLGAEDFGLVANFTVLVELFLAVMGMRLAFYYSAEFYQSDETGRNKVAFNILVFYLLAGLIIGGPLFIFSGLITDSFLIPLFWQYVALFIVFNQLIGQLLTTHLRMSEQAKKFGILQFIRSLISAGLSVLFVITLAYGWEGRVYAMTAAAMFLGIIGFIYFLRSKVFSSTVDWQLQKKLLLFGLPMLPYALSPWLKNGIEKVFVTQEVSLAANGVYSLAISLGSVFGILASSFFATYTPMLYKTLSNKNNQQLGKIRLVKQGYLVGFGFLVVLAMGYFILRIIILDFFSVEYEDAVLYLPLILASVWIGVFTNLFKTLIIYTKKTKLLGVSGLILAVIQVPLTYYFILHFGTMGAPMAGLIGGILLMSVYFFISQREIYMPWFYFMKN